MILLGYLYLASHQPAKAADTFNLAILSHPDNFMDAPEDDEIQELIECGMYEQGLEMIKSTIEQMGPTQDLLIRMADLYSAWEKLDEAIACYEHIIRMQPNSLEATIKLGTHYLRYQRLSLAAEQFNKASEINDQILDAYMGLALSQNRLNENDQALQTLSLASSIHKNSVLLYTEAMTLQYQAIYKEHLHPESDNSTPGIDDVISAYRELIKIKNSRPDVHYKYGILMMGENKLPAAISAFENAVALNPMYYRAYYKLLIGTYDNHQEQKALEILARPTIAGAGMFEQYYQMTILYADKKNFAQAIKKLSVINGTGIYNNSDVRVELENMLEMLGMIDRSVINWERINEISQWLQELSAAKADNSRLGHSSTS